MKKTLYLLNIGDYEPEITAITYPFIERWASRIGAEIVKITERKYPEYPVVYEKLQVYEIEKERQSDWIIYVDSDALIHPDFFDITALMPKDTVLQHGHDFSLNRTDPDEHMIADGRFIGTCNWFTVFPKSCIELYRPLDISLEEALPQMHPVLIERQKIQMERGHLIDDFTITRNLARFGFAYTTLPELLESKGARSTSYFFHDYMLSPEEKVAALRKLAVEWTG